MPTTRCTPRTTCGTRSRAASGTAADTIAQYGWPIPSVVASAPATRTPPALRSTCRRATPAYDARRSGPGEGAGRPRQRRQPAPAAPTPSAKSAEAPATAAATGTSEGVEGTEAHAANENTRNSGPGGCQSCASESSDPPAATSAATGTATSCGAARCPPGCRG